MAKQTFTTGQVLTAAQMTSLQQTAMGGGSTTAKVASYVLVAADAGTVVQMNAAGATTITVNTALFAAGDTVQIQNIGAGVCTVTAGTATVSTSATLALKQYDAGTLYFNTTSAALFFAVDAADGMANVLTTTGDIIYSSSGSTPDRLGIGTTGQVLNVASGLPAWATPASSGGMTLLSTTNLSGSSTTVSSISSAYKDLQIEVQGITSNSHTIVNFVPNGTANFGGLRISTMTGTATTTVLAASNILGNQAYNANNSNGQFVLKIYDYALTTNYKVCIGSEGFITSDPNVVSTFYNGQLNATTAISSFTCSMSGTFSAGTIKVYGVN